ncbi:6-phosphogluconolactonase [Phaeovulum sp.]|uniref:6-phosphogluconolactonase n=1 Tax=Phaeovulum sp. TaxID=2934796 RepID=UPI0027306A41|nr:6-phosphogluconolactonase [Phaeovulum sp.]MDP1667819.1 6-phosphogluconolactonase [Phaeovulum sp.]MDZ4118949.1 6-phosphogluconolactonase [Phaeovulum sp.]
MIWCDYPDREMMALALADRIAAELAQGLRSAGRASLCVPGGSTPGPVFDLLSGVDLDWANIAVFLGDERWVPESSERSNTRQLRARLMRGRAAAARLVPMRADTAEPEVALAALAEGIAPHLPITVLLLGMGNDMHTASLFPGADRLAEALAPDAPVLMALRAPGLPEPRITLTAPVLAGALNTHVLITGTAKRAAILRAEALPPTEAPISALLSHATIHWAE